MWVKERIVVIVAIFFGLLGFLIWLRYTIAYTALPSDFTQDYIAAYALRTGEPIYGESIARISVEQLGFRADENVHPPIVAVLILPLSYLPYFFAVLIWNTLNLGAYLALIGAIVKKLKLKLLVCQLAPLFLLVWYPFISNSGLVQSSLLVGVMIIAGWILLRDRQDYYGGVLLGLATLIKVYPAFLLIFLVLQRRWRATAAMSSICLLALLIAISVHGSAIIEVFFAQKVMDNLSIFTASPLNASLPGTLSLLLSTNTWSIPAFDFEKSELLTLPAVGVLTVLFVLIGIWRRRDLNFDEYFALAILTMLLVSPITWAHALPLMLLPIGLLLRHGYKDRPGVRIAICAIVLTAIPDIWIANLMFTFGTPNKVVWYLALATRFSFFALLLLWITFARRIIRPTS